PGGDDSRNDGAYSRELAALANRFTDAVRPIFEALRAGLISVSGHRYSTGGWSYERSDLPPDLWELPWRLRRDENDAILEMRSGDGGLRPVMCGLRLRSEVLRSQVQARRTAKRVPLEEVRRWTQEEYLPSCNWKVPGR